MTYAAPAGQHTANPSHALGGRACRLSGIIAVELLSLQSMEFLKDIAINLISYVISFGAGALFTRLAFLKN